jgi:hypothetical protein
MKWLAIGLVFVLAATAAGLAWATDGAAPPSMDAEPRVFVAEEFAIQSIVWDATGDPDYVRSYSGGPCFVKISVSDVAHMRSTNEADRRIVSIGVAADQVLRVRLLPGYVTLIQDHGRMTIPRDRLIRLQHVGTDGADVVVAEPR